MGWIKVVCDIGIIKAYQALSYLSYNDHDDTEVNTIVDIGLGLIGIKSMNELCVNLNHTKCDLTMVQRT